MTLEEYHTARDAQRKAVEETVKAQNESAPTPTQEELDLMMLGLYEKDAHPAAPARTTAAPAHEPTPTPSRPAPPRSA